MLKALLDAPTSDCLKLPFHLEIEGSIERYITRLNKADQKEPEDCEIQTKNLTEKIESLKETMERTRQLEAQLLETPEKQI